MNRWLLMTALAGCGRTPLDVLDSEDRDCAAEPFASEVRAYEPDRAGLPPTHPNYLDPTRALGAPDYYIPPGERGVGSVGLGQGGRLELGFSGCLWGHDRTDEPDLILYEAGPDIEGMSVFVQVDGESVALVDPTRLFNPQSRFFHVADVGGGTTAIDLDAVFPPGVEVVLDAVMFIDDPAQGTGSERAAGADIDAVEMLVSAESR